jgi:hypothetical protein
MKELINSRLGKIEDLEQRKLLKQVMTGVFTQLVEHQEEMLQRMERKVFEEIENHQEKQYDIYVTLCSRAEVDPTHEFLFPMLPGDEQTKDYDMVELASKLRLGEEMYLLTIFLKCGYLQLKELLRAARIFQGQLVTDQGIYPIQVRLTPNRSYVGEIEKLYHSFILNNIPWRTVNHPYAGKFFDVYLVGCEQTLTEAEQVKELRIQLEEYDSFKRTDIIPLWNIEKLILKNSGFPVPAGDRINYEHHISLRKLGTSHGYLVDAEETAVRYMKRSADELTIVSPHDKAGHWNILKVTQPDAVRTVWKGYELVSNRKHSSFMSGFASKQRAVVRTKGEISRIVRSLSASEGFEFAGAQLVPISDGWSQSYEMNPFVYSRIGHEDRRSILRLTFHSYENDSFLEHDLLSFIVSEVQLFFPEYRCEGVIL